MSRRFHNVGSSQITIDPEDDEEESSFHDFKDSWDGELQSDDNDEKEEEE